ncbi:uncharacterized protein F5891DRAFT_1172920 [Suillus fuscotomentosus]|uniref:Uncharacterized protein n=1 Tax=Suillus fuscotomentosus TaxID=1912939 RepID=A0AAD4E6Q3_9AGAM|nr:uncharacterized protein F5891DRAFT_1172920 [Suillus fuscotomentosus]KAG1900760.1 hypothetical protein F5891DRAFT_1172920 [Suillus fuscotomentosus]
MTGVGGIGNIPRSQINKVKSKLLDDDSGSVCAEIRSPTAPPSLPKFEDRFENNLVKTPQMHEVKSRKVKIFHVSEPECPAFLTAMLAKHDKSLHKVTEKERFVTKYQHFRTQSCLGDIVHEDSTSFFISLKSASRDTLVAVM